MHKYYAYGTTIHSEIPLPDLSSYESDAAQISIKRGDLCPCPTGESDESFQCAAESVGSYLHWTQIGTFLVAFDGSTVTVDVDDEINPDYVTLAVCGPVLGIAMHNQGKLVLHAAAVKIGSEIALFLGPSGSGKSTMIASLVARGHQLFCDDIVALNIQPNSGTTLVHPGIGRIKLWPDSVDVANIGFGDVKPLYEGFEKLSVTAATDNFTVTDCVPVGKIFVLQSGDEIRINAATQRESLLYLISNCYAGMIDKTLGAANAAAELVQCSQLANEADVLIVSRPPDLRALGSIAQQIESLMDDTRSLPEHLATGD